MKTTPFQRAIIMLGICLIIDILFVIVGLGNYTSLVVIIPFIYYFLIPMFKKGVKDK